MACNVTEVLGVLGFILALASLFWQAWAHRDARRERVAAQLDLRCPPGVRAFTLFVRILNAGRVPVYLKEVALCSGKVGEEVESLSLQAYPGASGPLQVGQERQFILAPWPPEMLHAISLQPEDRVWLSVSAPKGEILRIEGAEVRPYLAQIAKFSRSQPSGGAPAHPGEGTQEQGPREGDRDDGPAD
jgi:hypothetical protein